MFSVTMIAASTSSPTAMASPPSVMVFSPTFRRSSRMPASAMDIGIVSVTMIAARTSPSSANSTKDDERRTEQDRSSDAAERRLHQRRLVVDDAQHHAFRQSALDLDDGLPNALGDLDRVRSELFDDARADDLAFQPVGHAPSRRWRLTHVGDVADQHGRRAAHNDHGLTQLVDAGGAAEGSDRPFHRTLTNEATGGIDVRRLHGVHHFVETDPARGHALRIELHLELAQVSAEPFDGRDARDGEQPILHVEFGEIAQRHQIRGARIRFERELEDLVESSGDAGQERRFRTRRQLRPDLIDPLGDELARAVIVGVGLEFDRHLTDAELRHRPDSTDIRQSGKRRFERNGDAGFQLLGAHRRVLDDHVEDRRGQIRKDVAPQVLQRHRAEDRAGEREDDRERRPGRRMHE